jgi:hypothetical protein
MLHLTLVITGSNPFFSMRLQPDQSEHPLRGTQSSASLYREDKPGLCAGERGVYTHSTQW